MRRTLILTIVVVVFTSAFAFAGNLSQFAPEAAGDMKRIQLITGPEAQAEVDKLHGKPLPAEASLVARYSRSSDVAKERPAELWLSRVSSAKEARRQTGQMVHMMYENPKSPFKNPSRVDHAGNAVYRFTGMGQVHLIWFKDDLVYWVSCGAGDETLMLDTFCKQ